MTTQNNTDTTKPKGNISGAAAKLTVVAGLLLLSACATDRELQEDPDGFDAPRPSPCACDPIPYKRPNFNWSVG